MITFLFLNVFETIPMSGNIIGFDWKIRKLYFLKLSILDLTVALI